MRITEISTPDLERILADTERTAGPGSRSAQLFRQELERRSERYARQKGDDEEAERKT